jgi:hypothetical protein
VSRAESGRLAVSGERLELYAAALGYPTDLSCLDPQVHGAGVGLVHHRERASLTVSALRRRHAHLALTRVQLQGVAACRPGLGVRAAAVPAVALDALTTSKDAARQVRKAWGMPPGPAADITASLEEAGALVVARDIRSAFAPRVGLELLARLKREWKVSMAALLRRAQSLNIVTDWQYRSVMVEMSALGYRTAEPVEIDRERPRYVPGLICPVAGCRRAPR